MGQRHVGRVREELADKYSQEADELGVSRAEYIRKCIEVGRLTFRTSGEVDIERLRNLTEGGVAVDADTDLKSADGDLSTAILRNLPTDEDRALSEEELREAVFGTKSEQREEIVDALKELRQADMIEPLVEGGYIKTGEYNE